MNKITPRAHIIPEIRDIWIVARVVQMTIGFNLGLYLYVYGIFFYEAFGGESNPVALSLTASIFVIGQIIAVLAEVPTGALGDYIGRKKTVITSFIFRALFFFFLAWIAFVPSTKWAFVLAAIAVFCFAIGYTFYSGSFVAWVVDSLRERNHAKVYGPILARSYAHMVLAQIIGALIGLTLYLHGYVFYAFALGFTSCILCAVFCAVVMKEAQSLNFYQGKLTWGSSARRMKEIIVNGFKISVKIPPVTYLMLMYASFMFLTHVVSYLWPVAMKTNFGAGKMSPIWYLIVALSLALTFFGSKTMEWISHAKTNSHPEGQFTNRSMWLWFAFVALVMSLPVVYLGIKTEQGSMSLYLFVTVVALSQFGYGFLRPCYETLVNNYIPEEHSQERATVMSLAGMLGSMVVICLMIPATGKSGEATTAGWLIPSGLLAGLTLVLHLLMRRYQRKTGELPGKATEKAAETI